MYVCMYPGTSHALQLYSFTVQAGVYVLFSVPHKYRVGLWPREPESDHVIIISSTVYYYTIKKI